MPDDLNQSWFRRLSARVVQTFSTTRNRRLPGVGLTTVQTPTVDHDTTALVSTREAFEAQVTSGAGPMIDRHSTYPATSLDPTKIDAVFREATLGIVYRYADFCEQIRHRDAHLRSVDHGRRAAVANKPFLVLPKDDTPLAKAMANYCRAVVDEIDGFSSSIYSTLVANCDGYGAGEIVYQPGARRFPDAGGRAVMVRGLFPRRIPWVHGKHFRFQQDNRDIPLLDVGSGRLIDLVPGKFLFHRCMGDGISTMRGYIRSVAWLHFLKHASLRDWGVFLHLYGIPQLRGELDPGLWNDAKNRQLLEDALVAYGTGESAPVLQRGMDIKVEQGPTPAAVEAHKALCGYCDSSISKAVQGETLTTEMSQSGSYNASETHAQTKHDVILGDAVTMAEDIRADVFRPAIEINIDALALALGAPPDEIRAVVPRCAFETDRETSPEARMRIITGYATAGVPISMAQIREENNLRPPSSPADTLRGEAVTVSKGGATVGAVEAAHGVNNPDPDDGPGGGKPPETPSATHEAPSPPQAPIQQAHRFDAGNFDESKHPRGADGKFGPGGGGASGSGDKHAERKPRQRRTPEERAAHAKAKQERREAREKRRAEREAAHKAKQERKEARVKARAERLAAKAARRQQREERRAAIAKRKEERAARLKARIEKRAKAAEAARQLGAPRKADGKIDASRVPGTGKAWQVRTSEDPENSFKGRSYAVASAKDALAEFLAAPATAPDGVNDHGHRGGWTNADVIEAAMGSGWSDGGGDSTVWKELRSATGQPVRNFEDAMKALMPARGRRGQRDWRDFNLEQLRDAHPAFQALQLPGWLHDAENHREMQKQIADYYEDHGGNYAEHDPNYGDAERDVLPERAGGRRGADFYADEVPF